MLFGQACTPAHTVFRCPGCGTRRCLAKKKCERVLTVKKSVIRFRPADIAAEESEQNRHRADKLVPDVHRNDNHGGVGPASLQESSCRSDYAPVSPLDAGVSVSVPSRITCGRFPTTACRCGVWFNWALQLHSSLTRSQLHGHCKSCEKETHRQKGCEKDCRQEGRQEGRPKRQPLRRQ